MQINQREDDPLRHHPRSKIESIVRKSTWVDRVCAASITECRVLLIYDPPTWTTTIEPPIMLVAVAVSPLPVRTHSVPLSVAADGACRGRSHLTSSFPTAQEETARPFGPPAGSDIGPLTNLPAPWFVGWYHTRLTVGVIWRSLATSRSHIPPPTMKQDGVNPFPTTQQQQQ